MNPVITLCAIGTILISRPDNVLVKTQQAEITIRKGAVVLVEENMNTTIVYCLTASKPKLVTINNTYTLAPSQFISIGQHLTCIPGIKVIRTKTLDENTVLGNFLISSALLSVPEIYQSDRKTTNAVINAAALLDYKENTLGQPQIIDL